MNPRTVRCDSKCFNKKFTRCAQNYITDIEKVYSSCDTLKQQARCVYSAALDCETAFIPEAYWHKDSVVEICDKKSEYLEKHRKCLANAVKGANCLDKYKNIMKDKKTAKEILGGLKEVCKEGNWFGKCMQGNTEDFCGGIPSDYLYDGILIYMIKLQKLLCSEVILPADESIPESVILGLPRFTELTVALLNFP
ncbi:hypothetical protein HNY73_019190 [Argiope bruennichi]|uniref:DUF19 domain-containing protein n=1 Tax=Argiope bruennichi TaxID=94029 RepID=A0A8T0EGP3_ARGBR|nr:hypothetical protein HNY73_019190 [Argiope bruennichi]